MGAKLKNVNYDITTKQAQCLVALEVQGVVTELKVTVSDADLELLAPDWWLPECCTACSTILGMAVEVFEPPAPVEPPAPTEPVEP